MTHEKLQTLLDKAEQANTIGNFGEAEVIARKILSGTENLEEFQEIYWRTLLTLSESLWQRGMAKVALPYSKEALSIAKGQNNKLLQAKTFGNIGTVHYKISDYPRALEYYHKALEMFEAIGNQSGVATNTGNIGIVYWYLSDYHTALEYFHKALAMHEVMGDKSGIARNYGNIGLVYMNLSDYSQALEYMQKTVAIFEVLDDKSGVATNLGNIGNVYLQLSDYSSALEYYHKALAMCEAMGDLFGIASNVGNIGLVYVDLSDYSHALECLQKTVAIYEELGDKSGIANNLGIIGIVYWYLSDYPCALKYDNKALAMFEEIGDKSGMARNLGNIGLVYQDLLDYYCALEYLQKTVAIYEELGNKSGIANNLGNIGKVYSEPTFENYDAAKAEEYLLKAIAISEELGTKQILYRNHKALAELYEQVGRWQEGQIHFKKFYELEKEVQSEEAKKLADKLAYERREAEREKQLATERARLEEREKIIDELTELNSSLHEANRQKNEVLGIVAHDLKNPLAAILLSSGTLTRYLPNLNQDEILDQLGRIKSTAERMNQIILNLLDIQKLEAGKLSLDLKPLEISSILRTMSKNFQDQAEKKNIKIQTEIPDFLTALAENSAFQEIIENLISNALKFSPFDKNIFVRAESFDQFVRISIQDEGPGLTDDDKSKLFGQFTRLSAKPTGGEHSTGLGLSIVKRMVEMMNGKIWCESEVGNGATFILELKIEN